MLIYKNGDILKATENIICHQVNVDGIMGGGLALQIAKQYPRCEVEYKWYCKFNNNNYETLKGCFCSVLINRSRTILNCFTQKPNFDTDYEQLKICFERVLEYAKKYDESISVPYGYGCGIANGNWLIIEKIFEELSEKYNIDISVYKLER